MLSSSNYDFLGGIEELFMLLLLLLVVPCVYSVSKYCYCCIVVLDSSGNVSIM